MKLLELEHHTLMRQLTELGGPVVLINHFEVAPEDAEAFVAAWADHAAFMRGRPGCLSAQLHKGAAGSTIFVNVATWESAAALGAAFHTPEFQARMAQYLDSVVATPHLFSKVAVAGICSD